MGSLRNVLPLRTAQIPFIPIFKVSTPFLKLCSHPFQLRKYLNFQFNIPLLLVAFLPYCYYVMVYMEGIEEWLLTSWPHMVYILMGVSRMRSTFPRSSRTSENICVVLRLSSTLLEMEWSMLLVIWMMRPSLDPGPAMLDVLPPEVLL